MDDVVQALLVSTSADSALGETIDARLRHVYARARVVDEIVRLMRPSVGPRFGGGARTAERSGFGSQTPNGQSAARLGSAYVARTGTGRYRGLGTPRGDCPMRILVTGHHGYIGSVLAPVLRDEAPRSGRARHLLLRRLRLRRSAGLRAGARRRRADVQAEDLEGFDAIVHLAALSNDPLGDFNPGWTYGINRDATITLARAAKAAGVRRFVFASSCSMYGQAEGDAPLDEGGSAAAADALCGVEGLRGGVVARASPTPISRRSSCGMRPSTVSRLDFGSTSCSTTSSRGRTPPGRSGYRATVRRGGHSSMCATSRRQASP